MMGRTLLALAALYALSLVAYVLLLPASVPPPTPPPLDNAAPPCLPLTIELVAVDACCADAEACGGLAALRGAARGAAPRCSAALVEHSVAGGGAARGAPPAELAEGGAAAEWLRRRHGAPGEHRLRVLLLPLRSGAPRAAPVLRVGANRLAWVWLDAGAEAAQLRAVVLEATRAYQRAFEHVHRAATRHARHRLSFTLASQSPAVATRHWGLRRALDAKWGALLRGLRGALGDVRSETRFVLTHAASALGGSAAPTATQLAAAIGLRGFGGGGGFAPRLSERVLHFVAVAIPASGARSEVTASGALGGFGGFAIVSAGGERHLSSGLALDLADLFASQLRSALGLGAGIGSGSASLLALASTSGFSASELDMLCVSRLHALSGRADGVDTGAVGRNCSEQMQLLAQSLAERVAIPPRELPLHHMAALLVPLAAPLTLPILRAAKLARSRKRAV